MPIYFLCLCPPRLSIKLNFYIECGLFFKSISYVWTQTTDKHILVWSREYRVGIQQPNYVFSYIKHFNWDATRALSIGKLLTGPAFK